MKETKLPGNEHFKSSKVAKTLVFEKKNSSLRKLEFMCKGGRSFIKVNLKIFFNNSEKAWVHDSIVSQGDVLKENIDRFNVLHKNSIKE